jgi:hypothetical protein
MVAVQASATGLLCLQMGFTAYFRVELALAKLLGIVLLLSPVPARLKEWAYAECS